MRDSGISINRRILIVDDTPMIHDDFRKILTSVSEIDSDLDEFEAQMFGAEHFEGATPELVFQLDSANQGEQGVQMVGSAREAGNPYAMAFVDMRMPPGWDGLRTIEEMWKNDPNLEIVLCTAYSDYSWTEIAAALNRPEQLLILKKPFDSIEAKQLAACLTQKWEFARQSRCRVEELKNTVVQRTSALDLVSGQNLRLLEWAGQAIIAVDLEGIINLATEFAAETLGCQVGDLNGKSFHEIIHPDHGDSEECHWKEYPRTAILSEFESGEVAEESFCRKDGSQLKVDVIFNETFDSNGNMNGAVIMFCRKI